MKYLAAVLCMGMFFAGAFFPAWQSVVVAGFLSGLLGILFAHAEQKLIKTIGPSLNLTPLTTSFFESVEFHNHGYAPPLYFAAHAPGIHPVHSAFIARIDERQALILETTPNDKN